MPRLSNKKMRGRQRRIAKNNKNIENGNVRKISASYEATSCLHGGMEDDQWATPKGQDVYSALRSIMDYSLSTPVKNANRMVANFPQSIKDDETFALLKAQIISLGIGALLGKDFNLAMWYARLYIHLEDKYDCSRRLEEATTGSEVKEDETKEKKKPPQNKKKNCKAARDLIGDRERGFILFFDREVKCKCLKDLFMKYVKNQPKVGACFKCKQEMEYMVLKKCKRCSIAHYCNRYCQVEDWPHHKTYCDSAVEGTIDPFHLW